VRTVRGGTGDRSPKGVAKAALMLSHARWKMGSPDLAREAWTTAMAFGASNASCESAHMLGDLLRAQDDAHEAATAYEFVISSRHPTAYLAAKQLADLHMERDDHRAARAALRTAVGLGDAAADKALADEAREIAEYVRRLESSAPRSNWLCRLLGR
jgi:hypothetical protein